MRAQIEAIAATGEPSVDQLIEHWGSVELPQQMVRIPLVAVGDGGKPVIGAAQGELDAAVAFEVWLHKTTVIQRFDELIDARQDDANALSQRDRDVQLKTLAADRVQTERMEAALVFAAWAAGDNSVEHRPDASPLAVLGIALRTTAA